jgi:hypothetical protein
MKLLIKIEGISQIQNDLKNIVTKEKLENALELAAIDVEREAKFRCPVATGHLKDSIQHRKIGELTQEVRASAKYADYVEYGTMAHWIFPKNKSSLAWTVDGTTYFSKGVYHPGVKSGTPESPRIFQSPRGHYPSYSPYLRSAAYDKIPQIIKRIEKSLDEGNRGI